jgi:large subunit ribosomal protein L23
MIFPKLFQKKEKKIAAAATTVSPLPSGPRTPSSLRLVPWSTEKTGFLAKVNQYIFRVPLETNKTEIKKAIEAKYRVKILGLRIVNLPAKIRRRGRQPGWTKAIKKAVVKLAPGQKIEA